MKTTKSTPAPPLNDVLEEFALTYKTPDAKHLEKYIQSYPEYTQELTELAVELSADASASREKPEPVDSDNVLQMISLFHNKLHEARQAIPVAAAAENHAVEVANPFVSFSRERIREFTEALKANKVFFIKLRDRQISRETMTESFIAKVARLIGASAPSVADFFAGGVQLAGSTSYKADQKPQIGQKESFENAVRNSNLTPEQQEFLLNL